MARGHWPAGRRRPRIGVLYAPGTNCHEETAFAVELAGGLGVVLPLHDLLTGAERLRDYQGLVLPGGFSYGDHLAAGRVLAVQLLARLRDAVGQFANRHPVLGICNGYQVLMETGLLPICSGDLSLGKRTGALAQNRSARFESRWARLLANASDTFWTDGVAGQVVRLPVAHGEGRMLLEPGCCALPAFTYVDDRDQPTEKYPWNPAGSRGGVAGTVDASGLIAGLMPHPERAALPAHGSTDGLRIFQNMVRCCGG
jgi:phosphoribosylformylglycinamidine synthase